MAIYQSRLTEKREVAEGTMEFVLEKPAELTYRAGQFFDIILEKSSPDAEKSTYQHGFSFASAPYEPHIAAATRMRAGSKFKQALGAMPVGAPVKIEAVWGDYVLSKKTDQPAVFLIGGIGITPVRSMVAQATHDATGHKLTLIFSNRRRSYAPFVDDLKGFAAANPNFKFIQAYDEPSKDAADESGVITAEMVKRHVPDIFAARYYLSGPPQMVRAMRELLVKMEVDEEDIKTEEFDGY